MPAPRYRSRSLRRRKIRTPGGRTVTHYYKKDSDWAHCAICGAPLFGVPKKPKDYPKSSRRPERPYGGYICASCLRKLLLQTTITRYAPNMQ